VTVKYSPSTLALIFRPLLPTVTVVEASMEPALNLRNHSYLLSCDAEIG
jgi:hypothetical protein